MQIDFKWLAIIAFVIMGSVFAFGATSVSGAMDPVKQSQARLQDAQTADFQREVEAKRQRDAVDNEAYKLVQQAQVDAQKQQAALQVVFQMQQNAKQLTQMDEQAAFVSKQHVQELANAEQQSQVLNALLIVGGSVLALAFSVVFVVVAGSIAYKQIKLARRSYPAIMVGKINDSWQKKFDAASMQQNATEAQLREMQLTLEELQTRHRDSDGHGKDVVDGKNPRLTVVK